MIKISQADWDKVFGRKARPAVKKAAKKKVAKKKAAPRRLPTAKPETSCTRSPCTDTDYDPKLMASEIQAAKKHLGKPKLKRQLVWVRDGTGKLQVKGSGNGKAWRPAFKPTSKLSRPHAGKALTVSYGLGLDSTAILVGLVQEARKARTAAERAQWVPAAITFADTGGEKQVTYDYLRKINAYLKRNGFPGITVVAWKTAHTAKGFGSARSLEQQALINQTLPAISENAMRRSPCSSLWKQSPQNAWHKLESGLYEEVLVKDKAGRRCKRLRPIGGFMVKAIGYDGTEYERLKPGGGGAGATFRASDNKDREDYRFWYPLVEWGWDRARCRAEVDSEIGSSPTKSSCFFCGAMKPEEIVALSAEDLKRAVFMELVRKHGRNVRKHGSVKGLAFSWSWTDLALHGAEHTLKGIYKAERRAELDAEVFKNTGRRTMLTKREVDGLEALAKKWVKAAPGKRGARDMSRDPLTKKIPAFTRLRGLRGSRAMNWDRFDVLGNPDQASSFTTDTMGRGRPQVDLFGIVQD